MNTHDIKLPPMPSPFGIVDPDGTEGLMQHTNRDLQDYAKSYARTAIEADRQRGTAKQRYDAAMNGCNETDPIERLRFYCSLAMSGQDWIDVEPFFDALIADRKRSAAWDYCPECGSTESTSHEGCGNFCDVCGQEWHPDIDYTEAVQKNLADRQRRGEPIAWMKPDTVENQFINMRPRRVWWECNEGIGMAIYTDPQPAEPSGAPTLHNTDSGAQNGIQATQTAAPKFGEEE